MSLRISCPYTPEQKGLAERKHRHIEEMGLTLLTQAQLPRSLWLEAFSTAVYLINRLLTLVSVPPMRFFLGSDYTHLRVFGCACYPYLGASRKDKLSPKSIRCLFLGYSNVHKGYRSLDTYTGRGYISRHLFFDERSFPTFLHRCIRRRNPLLRSQKKNCIGLKASLCKRTEGTKGPLTKQVSTLLTVTFK